MTVFRSPFSSLDAWNIHISLVIWALDRADQTYDRSKVINSLLSLQRVRQRIVSGLRGSLFHWEHRERVTVKRGGGEEDGK